MTLPEELHYNLAEPITINGGKFIVMMQIY